MEPLRIAANHANANRRIYPDSTSTPVFNIEADDMSNGNGNGVAWRSVPSPKGAGDVMGLPELLERQLATAQQVLVQHHEQALRLAQNFCKAQLQDAVAAKEQAPPFQQSLSKDDDLVVEEAGEKLVSSKSDQMVFQSMTGSTESIEVAEFGTVGTSDPQRSKNRVKSLIHARTTPVADMKTKDTDDPRQGTFVHAQRNASTFGTRGQRGTGNVGRKANLYESAKQAQQRVKQRKSGKLDNKSAGHTVFADVAEMKAKVKEALMKPDYNVSNFYKTEGVWQAMSRHPYFESFTLGVIAANSIWIAVETDRNDSVLLLEAHPFFQVCENCFCIYFAGELFVRYMAFQLKRNCLKDAWFVFDSSLVLMMVIETWLLSFLFYFVGAGAGGDLGNASILRLVRLLRLTRMARMVRLLRALPELMILVKGVSVAMRSVFFTLVLLLIIIYIFAIAFSQLTHDTALGNKLFPSVTESMVTLLLRGTLPDLADFVNEAGQEHVLFSVMLLIFILMSTLTVLNMLVGVLCEVVSVVSAVEKEQMTVQFVKYKLLDLIGKCGIDQDGNKCIAKDEFERLILQPEGARIFEEVGVDVVGLVDFTEDIFKDDAEISFPDFMELVLQLRSNNQATVRDIIELRKLISSLMHEIHDDRDYMWTSHSASTNPNMKELLSAVTTVEQRVKVVEERAGQTGGTAWTSASDSPRPSSRSGRAMEAQPRTEARSLSPCVKVPRRPSAESSVDSLLSVTGSRTDVRNDRPLSAKPPQIDHTNRTRPLSGRRTDSSAGLSDRAPPRQTKTTTWLSDYSG